jgi:hypothetical protein
VHRSREPSCRAVPSCDARGGSATRSRPSTPLGLRRDSVAVSRAPTGRARDEQAVQSWQHGARLVSH